MQGIGARGVILAYLSTFEIGPGQKALRRDIEVWCYENQHQYVEKGIQYDTYRQQIGNMIIESGAWKDAYVEGGLNDVFCPCSADESYVVVYDPTCKICMNETV